MRSVLEGVAFALADAAEAIRSAGTTVDRLTVIGGGSRSRFWGTILAAAIGAQLEFRAGSDVGPALGAARLARLAVDGEPAETAAPPAELLDEIEPDPQLGAQLFPRLGTYRALYPALLAARPSPELHP